MKRIPVLIFMLCFGLCLCLAVPARAQFTMPQPKPLPAQTTGQATAPAAATALPSNWVQGEFMGCTFLYPPDFEIIEQNSENFAVGLVDQETHKGVVSGFVKEQAERMIEDMQSDFGSLEDQGPVVVDGQPGRIYQAALDAPDMSGAASMIIFDAPLADGDSLVFIRAVAQQPWETQADLLDNILSTMKVNPDLFNAADIFLPTDDASIPDPDPTVDQGPEQTPAAANPMISALPGVSSPPAIPEQTPAATDPAPGEMSLALVGASGIPTGPALNTTGWVQAEFMGSTFLYPPDLQVIKESDDGVAVGRMNEGGMSEGDGGAAFGLVKDDAEDMKEDMQSDSDSFEDLGPVKISGQAGRLYRALVNRPGDNMMGTAELIVLDKTFSDGDDLMVLITVFNADWEANKPVLYQIRSSLALNPDMFTLALETDQAPTPDATPDAIPDAIPDPVPSEPAAVDTAGWAQAGFLDKALFLYPPDFQIMEQSDDGIMVGQQDAENQGVMFGIGKDNAESMLEDMKRDAETFEEVGPVHVGGQPATLYRLHMNDPKQGTGDVEAMVLDTPFSDGDSLLIVRGTVNRDWDSMLPTLDAMLGSLAIDPAIFTAVEGSAAEPPTAKHTGELTFVEARSFRDAVGRNEKLEPDGAPDARFKLNIQGPGTVVGISLYNMSDMKAAWDTTPGNEGWALAVYQGKTLLNSEADGSLRFDLAPGNNKLDIFVQDNNAIAGGRTAFELEVNFEDGSLWTGIVEP